MVSRPERESGDMVSRLERVVIWSVDRRESGDMVSRPEREW